MAALRPLMCNWAFYQTKTPKSGNKPTFPFEEITIQIGKSNS